MPDSRAALAASLYERVNQGETDALAEVAAPDIEWDWSRSVGPDAGVIRGPEAVVAFVRENLAHWDSLEMLPEEVLELGDHVLVMVRVRVAGRDGIAVEATGAHVQTWREGSLVRYRLFQNREDALEALGGA